MTEDEEREVVRQQEQAARTVKVGGDRVRPGRFGSDESQIEIGDDELVIG